MTAGIVYYSDNRPDAAILEASRRTIAAAGLPIVAVTLQPIAWPAAHLIVLGLTRSIQTMFKQIVAGIEATAADVVFLAEHDVLYSPDHWTFRPVDAFTYCYNRNRWQVDAMTGRAVHYRCDQTSGLCAFRDLLLSHYRQRVAWVEEHGFSRANGFEPGTRTRTRGGFDDYPHAAWMSTVPNLDLRHAHNLTATRWSPSEFRNSQFCQGWIESDAIPGWGSARALVASLQTVAA